MDSLDSLKQALRSILSGSAIPEDPVHAENTVKWVRRIKPDSGDSLLVAALGHDIERAIEERKVKRTDYRDYDEFKKAHAENSAQIMREIMTSMGIDQKKFIGDVCSLVLLHETGGNSEADILRDADALSFFEVNLPYYYRREGFENTLKRCIWGYNRISPENRHLLETIKFRDKTLEKILRFAMNESSGGAGSEIMGKKNYRE